MNLQQATPPLSTSIAFDAPYDRGHIDISNGLNSLSDAFTSLQIGLNSLPNAHIYFLCIHDADGNTWKGHDFRPDNWSIS